MSILDFFKKKDSSVPAARHIQTKNIKSIKVLGAGCKTCHAQFEYAKKAAAELGLSVEVEYITDMEKVASYGAMSMPVIVVNEKIVSAGKLVKPADIAKLLLKA